MKTINLKTKVVKVEYGNNKGKSVTVPSYKGTLSISSSDYPEIKDWKTGEEYELVLRVKQTGSREADEWAIKEGEAKLGDINSNFGIIGFGKSKDKNKDKA